MNKQSGDEALESAGPKALKLMKQALALLDDCGAARDVSPHLDLAICRLRALLGSRIRAAIDLPLMSAMRLAAAL